MDRQQNLQNIQTSAARIYLVIIIICLHPSVVSGPRSVSSEVPQEPGLPGRPGQTGRHGHRHPGGFTQTGHGGGEFLFLIWILCLARGKVLFKLWRHRNNICNFQFLWNVLINSIECHRLARWTHNNGIDIVFQAPESYKNVTDVVNTCHDAGISKKAIKLRPIAVIKGWSCTNLRLKTIYTKQRCHDVQNTGDFSKEDIHSSFFVFVWNEFLLKKLNREKKWDWTFNF